MMKLFRFPEDVIKWIKKELIHNGPFDIAAWAEKWGKEMGIFGIETKSTRAGIDDDLDAFRHAFTSAVIVAWLPFGDTDKEIADWLGEMNEHKSIGLDSALECPKIMDLHNNKIGRELAPSNTEMIKAFMTFDNPHRLIAHRIAAAVKAEETINYLDDTRMPIKCFGEAKVPGGEYIWRTQGDDKVRFEHVLHEGKTFSLANPPPGGHPCGAYNCRCKAEPVVVREKIKN